MAADTPSKKPPRTDDSLAPARVSKQASVHGPGAAIVDNFLEASYATGPDAQAQYKAALADLRRNANEVVVALARAEAGCPRNDYPMRWALVYAATQLNHNATLGFLRDIVVTPIPPEGSSEPHSFSTVGEETILRTSAIEGIGRLARNGNKQALQALFDFLSIPSISIRRASVQAILALSKGMRTKIANHLPIDQRYLLDIVPKKVTQVPQIQRPEQHLRRSQQPAGVKSAPPALSEDTPRKRGRNPQPKLGG